MNFYITAIEQINTTSDPSGRAEYAATEKVGDYNTALSKYYKKLSDVSNDIGKGHIFMYIMITNSTGVKVKDDILGEYVDDELVQNPVQNPEPETEG